MSQPNPTIFSTIPTLKALKHAYPGVKSLFFDMDGTLFDTERFHTQAFLKIGKDHQVIPPRIAGFSSPIVGGESRPSGV